MMAATLTGSEKQVSWATEIRERRMAEVRETLDGWIADCESDAEREIVRSHVEKAIAALESIGRADFWIDRRGETVAGIIQDDRFEHGKILSMRLERALAEAGL